MVRWGSQHKMIQSVLRVEDALREWARSVGEDPRIKETLSSFEFFGLPPGPGSHSSSSPRGTADVGITKSQSVPCK